MATRRARLSKAQRRALAACAAAGLAGFPGNAIDKDDRLVLVLLGYIACPIEDDMWPYRYHITDAGRAALASAESEARGE